jgi:hypothetical protein
LNLLQLLNNSTRPGARALPHLARTQSLRRALDFPWRLAQDGPSRFDRPRKAISENGRHHVKKTKKKAAKKSLKKGKKLSSTKSLRTLRPGSGIHELNPQPLPP